MTHKLNPTGRSFRTLGEHKGVLVCALKTAKPQAMNPLSFCAQSFSLSPSSFPPPTPPLCHGLTHMASFPDKRETNPWLLSEGRRISCWCECMTVIASTFQPSGEVSKQVFCSVSLCVLICHVEGCRVVQCTYARAMMLSGRPARDSRRFRVSMLSDDRPIPLSDWPPWWWWCRDRQRVSETPSLLSEVNK